MNILLTGNEGYLGWHVHNILLGAGHYVLGYDLKSGLDILNDKLLKTFNEVDYVIHLAGIVGDPNCDADVQHAIKTNVDGSMNVIKLCKDNNIPLIFASSCSVYGASDEKLYEDSGLNPQGIYAQTKIIIEEAIRKELKHYTILRFGTIFGWSKNMRYDLVVNNFIRRSLVDKKITVFGGQQWRPFVHVKDVASAIRHVLGGEFYDTYNVTNINITLKGLGEKIQEFSNCEFDIDTRIQDKRNYKVSHTKLFRTGWEPTRYFEDAFEEIKEEEKW